MFLLAVAACTAAAPSPGAAPLKVMFVGDSITAMGGSSSYRYWLQQQINQYPNVFAYESVGSQTDGDSLPYDHVNEGHAGWSAYQIVNGNPAAPNDGKFEAWAAKYKPDIVLIHAGINDYHQASCFVNHLNCTDSQQKARYNDAFQKATSSISMMIDILRKDNPKVKIFLARITPTIWIGEGAPYYFTDSKGKNMGVIDYYNTYGMGLVALDRMLNVKHDQDSGIYMVDLYKGFIVNPVGVHTQDGLHPNQAGAKRNADRFFKALGLAYPQMAPRTP